MSSALCGDSCSAPHRAQAATRSAADASADESDDNDDSDDGKDRDHNEADGSSGYDSDFGYKLSGYNGFELPRPG